jgi:hypothetical protein
MARRGKKKSMFRRIRRLLFLVSAGGAIIRFAMARRPKPQRSSPKAAADWAPLAAVAVTSNAAADAPPVTDTAAATTSPDWVSPIDGACPLSHPVKGNANSRIYHRPGGRFYDSTVPERCYRDEAAAEADGMRASKR